VNETFLKRDTVSSFLITTPDSIGQIKAVRIWRNNDGKHANW